METFPPKIGMRQESPQSPFLFNWWSLTGQYGQKEGLIGLQSRKKLKKNKNNLHCHMQRPFSWSKDSWILTLKTANSWWKYYIVIGLSTFLRHNHILYWTTGFCVFSKFKLHFEVWTWWNGSLVAQLLKNLTAVQETWVDPWVRRSPEKGMATHSSILA